MRQVCSVTYSAHRDQKPKKAGAKSQMKKLTPIRDVIKELNLPQDTEFLGYVIRHPNSDELLAGVRATSEGVMAGWTEEIEWADRYDRYNDAETSVKKIEKEGGLISLLFDMGESYYVQPIPQ